LSNLLQQNNIRFRIVGRHVDAAVAEDKTNLIERNAVAQHLSCCRVPQQVGSSSRGFHTSPLKGSINNIGNTIARGERFNWSIIAEKDPIRAANLGPTIYVPEQCVANVLRQR
jgi:hypothetical protein